jgi:hypothetical protein
MVIIEIIICIFLAYVIYIPYRINKVYKFRNRSINLSFEWDMKHIQEIGEGKEQSAFLWFYDKQPSYNKMLYSLKPLVLDKWFDKKVLEKLFN